MGDALAIEWKEMTQLSIDQAMAMAIQHHQAQRYAQAEQIYRQVLAVAPNHPDALHLLGVIALDMGQHGPAIELISRAVAGHPNVADFQYNLGVALMAAKRPADAVGAFSKAVSIKPDMFAAYSNLAVAMIGLRRYPEAAEAARSAVTLNPDHSESWNNFGVALKETGKVDEAIAAFERAVAGQPDSPEALTNLGNALQRKGLYAEAAATHRKAVAIRGDVPELHNNLGAALYDNLEYEEAIEAFRQSLSLRPDYREAQCTLANSYYRLGRLSEAIPAARRAIALWPDSPLPKFNLGLMLLSNGEFEEGWRMNEARWDVPELAMSRNRFAKPRWDGSDLRGKTILLYGEQGFGDTIQFVRYIPRVREMGAKIVLGCQSELARLLKQVEGVEQVVSKSDGGIAFDVHCPLMSLPMHFGTNLTNIPSFESYLKADPELAAKWKERMSGGPDRLKVGLAWAGRPTHDNDRSRSISLQLLAPLAGVQGIWFCSLQKGDASCQAQNPPAGMQIADFSADVQDFADTAAMIANLDLVISVDTAAAHLAAAMGKPTWVLLPYAPDWRWLTAREDSPWYPTLRLFRQPKPRDWANPIQRVAEALRERAGSKERT